MASANALFEKKNKDKLAKTFNVFFIFYISRFQSVMYEYKTVVSKRL